MLFRSWEAQIYDSNFHFTYDGVNHLIGNALGSVRLGNNVWIGNRCTVAKGALLLDYTIIGSNSLVSKKLENDFEGGLGRHACPLEERRILSNIRQQNTSRTIFIFSERRSA